MNNSERGRIRFVEKFMLNKTEVSYGFKGKLVEIGIFQYHIVQKAFDQFHKNKRIFNCLKLSKVHFPFLLITK